MTMWTDLLMQVAAPILTTAGSIAAAVIAKRLNDFLKLKNEKQIRDALHTAAENGLKFAMARGTVAGSVLDVATNYVKTMNPGTVKKAGVNDDGLKRIIRTKAAGSVDPVAPQRHS